MHRFLFTVLLLGPQTVPGPLLNEWMNLSKQVCIPLAPTVVRPKLCGVSFLPPRSMKSSWEDQYAKQLKEFSKQPSCTVERIEEKAEEKDIL